MARSRLSQCDSKHFHVRKNQQKKADNINWNLICNDFNVSKLSTNLSRQMNKLGERLSKTSLYFETDYDILQGT